MLKILGILKVFGKKTVAFLTVIIMLLLLGGVLYWKYEGVKDTLSATKEEVQELVLDLEVSEKSLESVRKEAQITEDLLINKQEQWEASQKRSTALSKQLEKERMENEDLQKCLSVDMSDYANGVRQFPSYQNSDQSGDSYPE